jgi:uncharacterized protein (TIGR02466 family)
MSKPADVNRQSLSLELPVLQQMLQQGRMSEVQTKAQTLLKQYPDDLSLWNMLGYCQQAQEQYADAVNSYQKMLGIDNRIAEIHFNLASLYTLTAQIDKAIDCYQQAISLKPTLTHAHFNLAALFQQQGDLENAASHYQMALAQQPDFLQALGNLGTVYQLQGRLRDAEYCYRQVLAIKDHALGQFNLGTVLHDLGEHEPAISAFRAATKFDPQFADAWNNLGETLRDKGLMPDAINCYREAVKAQPDHARSLYNLGESCCLAGQHTEAIQYFAASDFADADDRVLQCLYKTRQFELFKQKLLERSQKRPHHSILLGTLSTHYAINFGEQNSYQFCPNPMDYVLHTRIDELATPDSPLLKQLIADIQHLAIAQRKQGRLYDGIQSAGNLLQRSEASFRQLATLIRARVQQYRQHFAGSSCQLIQAFPKHIEFSSSWYLRMKQGGHLTSHIHEEGWISGCVYLQLPDKNNAHEGSFEYSTDGDDYPRLHENFPHHIVDQAVGDLVLFPASLFHRTLPFNNAQQRVCIAFDVKPIVSI